MLQNLTQYNKSGKLVYSYLLLFIKSLVWRVYSYDKSTQNFLSIYTYGLWILTAYIIHS